MSICVNTIFPADIIRTILLNSSPKTVLRFYNTLKQKTYYTDKFWINKLYKDYNITIKKSADWYTLYRSITYYCQRYCFSKGSISQSFYLSIQDNKESVVQDLLLEPQIDPSKHSGEYLYTACIKNNTTIVKMLLDDSRINPLDEYQQKNAFIKMIELGRIEMVKMMMLHPRIDPTNNENEAIYIAAVNGQLDILKLFLVDSRISPNNRNNEVIRNAAHWGHPELVKILLQDPRVDPCDIVTDYSGRQMGPLQLACTKGTIGRWSKYSYGKGQIEVIKLLLDDPRIEPSVYDDVAMKCAVDSDNFEAIKLLLSCSKLNICSDYNKNLLLLSCRKGSLNLLEILLSDGRFDPSINNNKAINEACIGGQREIVEMLLSDPRVDISNNKNRPLMYAAWQGHDEIVELLLSNPKVNPSDNKNEVILQAVLGGHGKIVKLLLKDPRINTDNDFNKIFMVAVGGNCIEVIDILLSDPRIKILEDNEFLMQYAIKQKNIKFVKLLLSSPKFDMHSNYNKNLLIMACENGELELVKLLLADSRINPSANKNKAISAASTEGHAEIVELLLKDSRIDTVTELGPIFLATTIIGHTNVIKVLVGDSRTLISNITIKSAIECARIFKRNDIFKFLSMYDKLNSR